MHSATCLISNRHTKVHKYVRNIYSQCIHMCMHIGVCPKVNVYQMTAYDEKFPFPILFPKESMDNVLAEWLSKQGIYMYILEGRERH